MSQNKIIRYLFLVFLLINTLQVYAEKINIYVIGDSLSDQGNFFSATETELGVGVPAADHYFEGRFSDGLNYVDVIVEKLGVNLNPSFIEGNNFSYGGARVDYNRVEDDATKPFPFSFLGQQGLLQEDQYPWTLEGQRAAFVSQKIDDEKGLYIVFVGTNDIADLAAAVAFIAPQVGIDAQVLINAVTTKTIEEIRESIVAFVASGAQDILVPNLPNLGIVPIVSVNGSEFSALATQLSAQYNIALNEMLMEWEGIVNIIPFDTFTLITEVVSSPASFGFLNASEPCYSGFVGPASSDDTICDNPDSFVFFDKEHPTEAFHTLLANRMLVVATNDVLDDLISHVDTIDTFKGIKRSLSALLNIAKRHLNQPQNKFNNKHVASLLLDFFLKFVEVQKGHLLTVDDAVFLIERGEKVLLLLEEV